MQLRLGGALSALSIPFAKLVFWRKPAAPVAEVAISADTAAPEAHATVAEDAATPPPKPGLWARCMQLFRRRAAPSAADATQILEALPAGEAVPDVADLPEPKLTLVARIKNLLRPQRASDAESTSAEDAAPANAEEAGAESADAPAPTLAQKLRSKRVLIPAAALLLLLAIGGAVAAFMLHASRETQRLQQELQAAKHKLEQQQAHPVVAVAPPVAPVAAAPHPEPKASPKPDPAFDIVGAKPAPEAESGINAGDCVVSERGQVATNLKRCIEAFNAAVSSPAKKSKP